MQCLDQRLKALGQGRYIVGSKDTTIAIGLNIKANCGKAITDIGGLDLGTVPDIVELDANVVVDDDLMASDISRAAVDKGPDNLILYCTTRELAREHCLPANTRTMRLPFSRSEKIGTKASKNAGRSAQGLGIARSELVPSAKDVFPHFNAQTCSMRVSTKWQCSVLSYLPLKKEC